MHTVRYKNSCIIKHDALWLRVLFLLLIPDVGNIHVLPACNRKPSITEIPGLLLLTRVKARGDTCALEHANKNKHQKQIATLHFDPVSFQSCFLHCGCEPRGRAIERLSSQPFLSSPCPKLTLMKDKPKQEKTMHAALRTAPLQSPDPLVPEVAAVDLHSTSHLWISNLGLTFQKGNNSFQNYDFLYVQNRPEEVLMKRSEAESTV